MLLHLSLRMPGRLYIQQYCVCDSRFSEPGIALLEPPPLYPVSIFFFPFRQTQDCPDILLLVDTILIFYS